jgi:hypothetical protein
MPSLFRLSSSVIEDPVVILVGENLIADPHRRQVSNVEIS